MSCSKLKFMVLLCLALQAATSVNGGISSIANHASTLIKPTTTQKVATRSACPKPVTTTKTVISTKTIKPTPSTTTITSRTTTTIRPTPSTSTITIEPTPSTTTVTSTIEPTPSTITITSTIEPTPSTITVTSTIEPAPSTITVTSTIQPASSTTTVTSTIQPTPTTTTITIQPTSSTTTSTTTTEATPSKPLIWAEEFDSLNFSTWTPLITGWRGGNNEFQYYTNRSENIYVQNGVLHIKPTLTADRFGEQFLRNGVLDLNQEGCNINYDGNNCVIQAGEEIIHPIQSARIITQYSFSFTYGTVEVRAKMPRGDWIWPAIWMLPTEQFYGWWPRSGEIDIVEIRSNDDFSCGNSQLGNKRMGSTLHWGPDPGQNGYPKTQWEKLLSNSNFAADFHIYGLEWLPTGMNFYVDGEKIGSVTTPAGGFWELGGFQGQNIWQSGSFMAPFDRQFHFILNVAVGGNFFPDGCSSKPWSTTGFPQMRPFWEARNSWLPTWNAETEQNAMQIDYIRVYSL